MKAWLSTRSIFVTLILVTASLMGCVQLTTAAAASASATVHVSVKTASVGDLVLVTGSGWSPVGDTVQIELCGQDALNLSDDCGLADQYTAAIRPGGVFYGALTVHLPPTPCPCVVLVRNQFGSSGLRVPITIVGAPTAPISTRGAAPEPVAVSGKVLTSLSAGSWFGGPRQVTLLLRIRNRSTADFQSPALSVTVGRGSHPDGFVVAKQLGPLAAGSSQELRIPVTLPAFTFGTYSVRAQVITGQGQVATVVSTSSYPWALFLAGALVLQALLLLLRNRVRRRLGRAPEIGAPTEVPELQGADEPVEVIDLRLPALEPVEVTNAASEVAEPVEVVQLGQPSLKFADVPATVDHLAETVDVIDLRPPSAQSPHVWTTTHRLALSFPQQGLACAVEVLACPVIKLQRTRIRVWADFALSSWDALHEGSVWADLATDSAPNTLVPGGNFIYEGKGLRLEVQLDAIGPELAVGDNRVVVPVRVRGSASFGGDPTTVDIESVLEKIWVTDASEDTSPSDSGSPGGSLTYAQSPGGDSFYLQLGADGEPAGWLVRNGHPSPIVQAERRVEERAGPYPRRVVVELTDDLGRRVIADGTAHKGMASKEDEHLTLECRLYWNLDGVAAAGEDRSDIDLETWRGATRAAFYAMANQSGATATTDHPAPMPTVEAAEHLSDSARG